MNSRKPLIIQTTFGDISGIFQQGNSDLAVLMVNGGSQTRVGPHRLYVTLSQKLHQCGVSSYRFDLPELGDSAGNLLSFLELPALLNQVITQLLALNPTIQRLVLFGLCDGATAILLTKPALIEKCHAIALVNPWVRQEASHAATMAKHYYFRRLWTKQFWTKFASGHINITSTTRELAQLVRSLSKSKQQSATEMLTEFNYVEQSWHAWCDYKKPTWLFLSGHDLTAAEFLDSATKHPTAKLALASAHTFKRESADHTFSSMSDKDWLVDTFVQQINHLSKQSNC